jgi:hypothetical protein
MSAGVLALLTFLGVLAFATFVTVRDQKAGLPEARAAAKAAQQATIVCPHCHVGGRVTARQVKRKRGISGGKATGAVLTGGVSMLATGLSRKEAATEMKCDNCGVTWHV